MTLWINARDIRRDLPKDPSDLTCEDVRRAMDSYAIDSDRLGVFIADDSASWADGTSPPKNVLGWVLQVVLYFLRAVSNFLS